MTKEQKKAAIIVALHEYQDNLAAVQESDIPGGFDQLVRNALVKTLGDKLERIFDQPDVSFVSKVLTSATAKAKPEGKPAAKAGKKKR
ncbi:MAG: hypothetical protein ABI846_13825 [Rudaea sp.]